MEKDYQANDELDRYEHVGLDNESQQELSLNARMQADQEMERQERAKLNMAHRRPGAFNDEELEDDENEILHNEMRRERMRIMMDNNGGEGDQDPDALQNMLDFEDVKGPLSVWLRKNDVIKFITKQFNAFLRNFKDETGAFVYEDKIHEMCMNNKQSLQVVFTHLSQKNPTLAIWLAEEPALMLPILNDVAIELVGEVYPDYYKIFDNIFVRVKDLPVEDKLRDLRQVHLNALIKIRGVVTKRTGVFPELKQVYYRCMCGDLKGPFFHNSNAFEDNKQYLGQCVACHSDKNYHIESDMCVYRNYQKWTIQETPGSVPAGRVPRQKEVFILNDLVDTARPGDEVEITGIFINRFDYGANVKHGFPVFSTIIEANNVKRFGDENIVELTDEDKQHIRKLAKLPNIA